MLNKIALATSIMILWGCSPKYQIVYDFTPPSDISSKSCIKSCYHDMRSCQKRCESKQTKCYQKALEIAKVEYNKEVQIYHDRVQEYRFSLNNYISQTKQKDDLEERYNYYHDICSSKKDRYACQKANKYKYQLNKLRYINKPQKPQKPSLDRIIQDKKSSICNNNCLCKEQFRTCYISCGGVVKSKKVCIANCPDD